MVTLLFVCLGVRADENVVFEQHFESMIEDPTAVGYFEFINNEEGDDRTLEDGALKFINDAGTLNKTYQWRRAVKFRNLPLKEGIYRLSFKLKGDKTYKDEAEADVNCKFSALLLQGEDNADIDLKDFAGNEQRLEGEDFNPNEYVTYSRKIIFASEQQQKEAYTKGELADKFFMSLSVYNPGTFYIKDVVLTETDAVETAEFGMSAIKIKFCGATNIAAMANASPTGSVVFDDLSYASVTVNGAPAKIESIEYRSDGCLYIFTDPMESLMTSEDAVSVSFTNPTDEKQIKFVGKIESEASIFNFENVGSTYAGVLDTVFSYLWQAPTLVSSYPIDDSFAIDPQLGEFTFTFDRKVATAGIVAILDRGGIESNLILKEGQEDYAETVVFVRNDNGVLAKRNKITLSDVVSERGQAQEDPYVVNFEAGLPKVAQEIYTPTQTIDFTKDAVGSIPLGWTLVCDSVSVEDPGEIRNSGTTSWPTWGGSRLIIAESLYVRTNKANSVTTATFGNIEGYPVVLPVGDLRIQFLASGYKGAGQRVRCELLDATGTNVLEFTEHIMEAVTADGKPISKDNADVITIAYKNDEEKNAIIRYTVYQGSGMTETMLNSVIVNTYEKTEGDVPDDKTIMSETFAAWNDKTPATGSGWIIYEDGNPRPGGAGGNSRILACNGDKMKYGYFCRNFGGRDGNMENPGMYITYGEEKDGPKLTLEKGTTYEMTYYAASWNITEQPKDYVSQVAYAILDPNGHVVASGKKDLSKEADARNNAGNAFEADEFTYKFTPSVTGDYVLKFWGSHCTLACGNISFVLPGSRAVKYFALLAETVDKAKATLDEAEDPKFDGTTKTALAAAIAKYEDQSKITMTTEEEFNAAIAELNGLAKAMKTRLEYLPRFADAYTAAYGQYLDAVDTKYEKLEQYKTLEDVVNTFEGVNPSDLEDDVLVDAVTTMENISTLFKNMMTSCVKLLTNQIVNLAAQLVKYDESASEYVLAAGNALTDDQEMASEIKLRLTKAIYDLCAAGDPFVKEEVIDDVPYIEPVEIDATNYIQNANFYSTGGNPPCNVTDFPGWTINVIKGNIGATWGTASWCGTPATATNPVVDAALKTGWGGNEHDVQQLIEDLPVVKFDASIIVGEDGGKDGDQTVVKHEAYAYVGEGEEKITALYDGENPNPGEGQTNTFSRDTNKPRKFKDVAINRTGEGGYLGSILLGAHPIVDGGFTRTDNATLTMTGKVEGFPYDKAAEYLDGKITEIEKVQQSKEPAEAPVKVVYYDLNGAPTSAPQGIAIKVATYANGYMKVSKVVVK